MNIQRMHHIAIICSDYEDIRIDSLTGKKFTFFQDPDGLPLELYEEGN